MHIDQEGTFVRAHYFAGPSLDQVVALTDGYSKLVLRRLHISQGTKAAKPERFRTRIREKHADDEGSKLPGCRWSADNRAQIGKFELPLSRPSEFLGAFEKRYFHPAAVFPSQAARTGS